MNTVNIKLSKDQANRLSKFLDDFIYSDISDIVECVGYQVDYDEFKDCKTFTVPVCFKDDDEEYIDKDLPSFLGGK